MASAVGELMSKRGCRHQKQAVGNCITQNGRVPGIARREERRQIVIKREILLIVIAHYPRAVGINGVAGDGRAVQEARHRKRA